MFSLTHKGCGCRCHNRTVPYTINSSNTKNTSCCESTLGTDMPFEHIPCAYVALFECEHEWPAVKDGWGLPPSYFVPENTWLREYIDTYGVGRGMPPMTYPAVFLGKACLYGCLYVAKEYANNFLELPPHGEISLTGISHIHNLSGSTTFPAYTFDDDGDLIYTDHVYTLRRPMNVYDKNRALRYVFAGVLDSNDRVPRCHWYPVENGHEESHDDRHGWRSVWHSWELMLASSGNITLACMPFATDMWDAIGKSAPLYMLPADDWELLGRNTMELINWEAWPSLPKKICVVPCLWPMAQNRCIDKTTQCMCCAPALELPPGMRGLNYCGTGSVAACDADCEETIADFEVFLTIYDYDSCWNTPLPPGISQPESPCGYFVFKQPGESSCQLYVLVYCTGSLWRADVWCVKSTEEVVELGPAEVLDVRCLCDGVRFRICHRCNECLPCTPGPTVNVSITSDCPYNNDSITLTFGGVTWSGVGVNYSSATLYRNVMGCFKIDLESVSADCARGTFELETVSCDPLLLTFTGTATNGDMCDCGPTSTITITVTG